MLNKKFNINLNLYRSFYYVAKYGGFTKASQKELISQSALSMNIKSLEEILNTKFFNREGSNVTLTKSGGKLYLKLLDIINILNNDLDKKESNIGCSRFIADNYSVEFELPSSLLLKKLIIQDSGIGYININYILKDVQNNNVVILNNFNNVPYDKINVIYNN